MKLENFAQKLNIEKPKKIKKEKEKKIMAKTYKNTNKEITYKIIEEIKVLSENDYEKKMFAIVQWGDNAPKYEVRVWKKVNDGNGGKKLIGTKGTTFTYEELIALREVLADIKEIKAPAKKAPAKKVADSAKEKSAPKKATTRTRKTTSTAKKANDSAKSGRVVKAKEPTEEEKLAEKLNSMSAADLLKILAK